MSRKEEIEEEVNELGREWGKKLLELLEKYGAFELEGVEIEAEELNLDLRPSAATMAPIPVGFSITLSTGQTFYYSLAGAPAAAPPAPTAPPAPPKPKIEKIIEVEFTPPVTTYSRQIEVVPIGATKAEGGTRSKRLYVGGEKAPAFYLFEAEQPPPVIAMDVFDMPIPLAKPVKEHFKDVLDNPVEWARLEAEKFKADMISIHLVSTDPLTEGRPVDKAVKVVEELLQAVDVPIAVGVPGVPEIDHQILKKAAEIGEGERLVLNSANLDTDYIGIAEAAKKYGHVVIAFTAMDFNNQKRLNRELLNAGLPRDSLIMDPTTGALGYGIEYTFSYVERFRLAGLMGDEEVAFPISCATANAWGAREAWMKAPELGPRELRGPLWETVTALTVALAGADFFMMDHPAAIQTLRDFFSYMKSSVAAKAEEIAEWVSVKI